MSYADRIRELCRLMHEPPLLGILLRWWLRAPTLTSDLPTHNLGFLWTCIMTHDIDLALRIRAPPGTQKLDGELFLFGLDGPWPIPLWLLDRPMLLALTVLIVDHGAFGQTMEDGVSHTLEKTGCRHNMVIEVGWRRSETLRWMVWETLLTTPKPFASQMRDILCSSLEHARIRLVQKQIAPESEAYSCFVQLRNLLTLTRDIETVIQLGLDRKRRRAGKPVSI